jgi:uncharacterized protein (DUF488 family)
MIFLDTTALPPTKQPLTLYTIGHSNHTMEVFVDLLRRHKITTLVDVRSQPYSRWAPHFNKQTLAPSLRKIGLAYVYLGGSLGGRPSDLGLYDGEGDERRPSYERVAATPNFQTGLDHLISLAGSGGTAIMCAEGDHNRCHRNHLITPHLLERGARVMHIRPDGETVEAQVEPKQLALW